jgi:hypothetical protein
MGTHTQDQACGDAECGHHYPSKVPAPEQGIVTYFPDYGLIVILDVDFVSHGVYSEIPITIAVEFVIVKYSLVCVSRVPCDKLNSTRIHSIKA